MIAISSSLRALRLFGPLLLLFACHKIIAQDLQISYGSKGIQTLSFLGTRLADVDAHPSEAFHIWHMRSTDLAGKLSTEGQASWGETNTGEHWNESTHTEQYMFRWGAIETHFTQAGNDLILEVTETNRAGSGIIFDGAEIYPVTLHFPSDPAGFHGYTQYADTAVEPGISAADYGSGRVTSVILDESLPLYGGWKSQGTNAYSPILSGTFPDGIATFLQHTVLPVMPGQTLRYRVAFRFTRSGIEADTTDAIRSFVARYPAMKPWSDRRIIGTAFLASAASNADITRPAGYARNPRRYFTDPTIDITTPEGLRSFQERMLAQAASNAKNARLMNAQGVITWDIEGEEYPQSTSYVCSPDEVATVAPEMESIVHVPGSSDGQKLDDAYFSIMRKAGLQVGLCLRPQAFTISKEKTASQRFLTTNAEIVSNLERKARFAHDRWGATIFYIDSTVNDTGGTLDPDIFQQLRTDLPSFLFITEESTPRYYAYTAPFYSFLFHTDLGTPEAIRRIYPDAFGVNLINDVSPTILAQHYAQLVAAVMHGDILMGHVDAWHPNNDTLIRIYAEAHAKTHHGNFASQRKSALKQ